MTTCQGCGGIVGRDCFNPQECEWIARDQEVQARAAAELDRREREHYERLQRDEHEAWLLERHHEDLLEAGCGLS